MKEEEEKRKSTVENQEQQQESLETNTEEDGRLTSTETKKTGRVSWDVYMYYFKAVGMVIVILFLLFFIAAAIFSVIARFKLSDWSEDQTCTTKPDLCTSTTNQYIKSYFILNMMYVVCTIVRVYSFIPGRVRAGRILHHDLTDSVMDAPVSFHDITPVGRVLNRFNKDMFTVDYDLPDSLTMLLL